MRHRVPWVCVCVCVLCGHCYSAPAIDPCAPPSVDKRRPFLHILLQHAPRHTHAHTGEEDGRASEEASWRVRRTTSLSLPLFPLPLRPPFSSSSFPHLKVTPRPTERRPPPPPTPPLPPLPSDPNSQRRADDRDQRFNESPLVSYIQARPKGVPPLSSAIVQPRTISSRRRPLSSSAVCPSSFFVLLLFFLFRLNYAPPPSYPPAGRRRKEEGEKKKRRRKDRGGDKKML